MNRVIFRCLKISIILLILIFGISTVEAVPNTKPTLNGYVLNLSGDGIEDATVSIISTGSSTTTSSNGRYTIYAPNYGYNLVGASAPGYITKISLVYIIFYPTRPTWTDHDFILSPNTQQQLPDISITWNDISFEKVI